MSARRARRCPAPWHGRDSCGLTQMIFDGVTGTSSESVLMLNRPQNCHRSPSAGDHGEAIRPVIQNSPSRSSTRPNCGPSEPRQAGNTSCTAPQTDHVSNYGFGTDSRVSAEPALSCPVRSIALTFIAIGVSRLGRLIPVRGANDRLRSRDAHPVRSRHCRLPPFARPDPINDIASQVRPPYPAARRGRWSFPPGPRLPPDPAAPPAESGRPRPPEPAQRSRCTSSTTFPFAETLSTRCAAYS